MPLALLLSYLKNADHIHRAAAVPPGAACALQGAATQGPVDAMKARPSNAGGAGRADNRLKRDTPFICNIHYSNELPEVHRRGPVWLRTQQLALWGSRDRLHGLAQIPCDPKLVVAALQPDALAEFAVSTLEREQLRDLVLESDLGVSISTLDVDRYAIPADVRQLDPEDAALLEVPPNCACQTPSLCRTLCSEGIS